MTKKKQSYSTEFKAEAVKKIADNNGNLCAIALQKRKSCTHSDTKIQHGLFIA